jgi:hypothetical protein
MADPLTTTPAPSPAPAATAPVAAAASQTAAAPIAAEPAPVTTTPAAAPSPSPTAAPAAAAAKPVEPASDPSAPAPTLLEKFDKEKTTESEATAAGKPAAAAPAPQAKPAEPAATPPGEAPPAQAAPVAPAPVEYKYTLPETIQMDDGMRSEVHKAFDDFRANPSEGAQELINLHEKTMRDYAQFLQNEQHRIFAETRQNWAKEVLADPEIGGSGHQTAMGAIARMRDLLVPERDRPAFEDFLRTTGAGDHPQFLKLLHQAARYYDEPTLPPPNPRPAPGNGQRPSRRLRDVYDHPRSTPEGRQS